MKTVGIYDLGNECVQVVLRPGRGANYTTRSDLHRMPLVELGADVETWAELVNYATHEAIEFSFMRLGCRHYPSIDYARDSGAMLFVATHEDFAEACARTAYFLAALWPDLSRAWRAWKRRRMDRDS